MSQSRTGISLAVAFCSCAVLLSEMTLTRIFSVTLMYHYAFLVLSITLFGLGSGGIFHFISSAFRRRPEAAPWLALAAAITMPLCVGLILRLPFSPQVFSPSNMGVLCLIIVLASIPFFFAGLFISLLYIQNRANISRLYASDLLGAAVGCLTAVYLIGLLGAPVMPVVAGLLLGISGLLAGGGKLKTWSVPFGVLLISMAALLAAGWLQLNFVKGTTEETIEFEKWNAFSRVAVSRFGDRRVIHIDADAATEILSTPARQSGLESVAGITRLAHLIRGNSKALVIGPGGGREVGSALLAGSSVTGVEINPIIVNDLMLERYAEYSGHLYTSPGVRVVVADARSFLERDTEQYDLIQSNAVDTWAAVSGGGYTLSESYLYTVEAFETYFRHLTDDGVLTIGRWVFGTPQQMIRVIALALDAMDRQAPGDYRSRFFLASDRSYEQGGGVPGVVIIKKRPFSEHELQTLRQAASASGYEVLYDPAMTAPNPYVELINSHNRDAFFEQYPLNIRPPTDDKPFFFFTLKWKDVLSVWNTPAESRKNNAGLFLLAAAFGIMLVLTGFTFVLPLMTSQKARIESFAGFYFLCIGLAFMMTETVLIQRATLFLGHPTYSFPTVLCSLLIGAGFGSWLSRSVQQAQLRSELRKASAILVAGMSVLILVLPAWLKTGFQWPVLVRIFWLGLPLLVLGVLLGRLFPLGLKRLEERDVPWAWALNGSASVLGSIVAVLAAMQIGFSAVLWLAVLLYAVAGLSVRQWGPAEGES